MWFSVLALYFLNCLSDTYAKIAIQNIISPIKTWFLHFNKCIFEPAKQINQVKVLPRHSFKSDRGFYLPTFNSHRKPYKCFLHIYRISSFQVHNC